MPCVARAIDKVSRIERRSIREGPRPRAAYELAAAQVQTPLQVVSLFWRLAHERRKYFRRVLDLGAADGRFAQGGKYWSYEGIEIDPSRFPSIDLPKNANVSVGCAFTYEKSSFDACIGNPPYVRHHDIESPWKSRTAKSLGEALGVTFRLDANLYLYFLALACIRSKPDGLVGLILPHEWVARPSAKPLRDAIIANRWNVDIYRFQEQIFERVLTTASITFVDKRKSDGMWRHFDVDGNYRIRAKRDGERPRRVALPYVNRSSVWARRGISPGSQTVFVLTERERRRWKLKRTDVVPAITSLRGFPNECAVLTRTAFASHFVQKGRRCWLIKSSSNSISSNLKAYTRRVPVSQRDTATCREQSPWYAYEKISPPALIFHSCFTRASPKVVVNRLKAIPVGTTYGVYSSKELRRYALRGYLAKYPFRSKVVPHASKLRKVEVRQLNYVLGKWHRRRKTRG